MAKRKSQKPKEPEKKTLFRAGLEMTKIVESGVRFRVVNPRGLNVLDLHHIQIHRNEFPREENFSLDFLNRDLDKAEAWTPKEDLTEPEKRDRKKALEELKKLQARLGKHRRLEILIME